MGYFKIPIPAEPQKTKRFPAKSARERPQKNLSKNYPATGQKTSRAVASRDSRFCFPGGRQNATRAGPLSARHRERTVTEPLVSFRQPPFCARSPDSGRQWKPPRARGPQGARYLLRSQQL